MFSVKAPSILHSYLINNSAAWFLLCESDTLMLTSRDPVCQAAAEAPPISPDADTMMPQTSLSAAALFRSAFCPWLVSLYFGRHFICPRLHHRSGDAGAICSNSASNFRYVWETEQSVASPHETKTLYLICAITSLEVYPSLHVLFSKDVLWLLWQRILSDVRQHSVACQE